MSAFRHNRGGVLRALSGSAEQLGATLLQPGGAELVTGELTQIVVLTGLHRPRGQEGRLDGTVRYPAQAVPGRSSFEPYPTPYARFQSGFAETDWLLWPVSR